MTQPEFSFSEAHPSVKGMVRHNDHDTSIEAARSIKVNVLHEKVMKAFELYGPMNDETLETLSEFSGYGPSTIRKRRSELFQQGKLCVVGKNLNSAHRSMKVWDIL